MHFVDLNKFLSVCKCGPMISAMQKLFMELQNPFIKIEFTVEC